MKLKYVIPILFLVMVSLLFIPKADSTAMTLVTLAEGNPANNSYVSVNWIFFNMTANHTLNSTILSIQQGDDYILNLSMSNNSLTNWYLNVTNMNDTPHGVFGNYTFYTMNQSNETAQQIEDVSGIYHFRMDTISPQVTFNTGKTLIYNHTTDAYENTVTLNATILDNTTQDGCVFRFYPETINVSGHEGFQNQLYDKSAVNFTGVLSADTESRDCTYNLTGTELATVLTVGMVRIDAYSLDNHSNFSAVSTTNESLIFNRILNNSWAMLGNVEASMLPGTFANKTNGNMSYISLFGNYWDNKSYETYRTGFDNSPITSIDGYNFSGFFTYASNSWNLIRLNTLTADAIDLYTANVVINETKGNATTTDTNFTLSKVPVNSSYTIVVKNLTNTLTYTLLNATSGLINVPNWSDGNITFIYKWNTTRTVWNLAGVMQTNTTSGLANKSANMSYVSTYNASTGHFMTYRKGYDFFENVTVYRGQAVWVATNTPAQRDEIIMNNTATIFEQSVNWSRL